MTTATATRARCEQTMFDSPVMESMDVPTAVLQEVAKKHAHLINGLNAMYATLIKMRYLRKDEVIYPPYGVAGKPAVAVEQLRAAGFVPEVIALMELLPYPSNEAPLSGARGGHTTCTG